MPAAKKRVGELPARVGKLLPGEALHEGMHLLLGLDGSELSVRALEQTVERARETGDELTVAVYDGPGELGVDETAERARDHLERAGIDAEVHRLTGDPGSQLVAMADDGVDRIVLGGGVISPMGKIRIGDVIEFVLVNAQTTVTLVR